MDHLVLLIENYKYLILLPLAIIEGPIVSLAAGFLIHVGYIKLLPTFAILIVGDLLPDTIYYYIGRIFRLNTISNLTLLKKLWQDHPRKTAFFSKLAYGLSIPFLISAGLAKIPYKKFISYTFPVTLFQYGVIMAIGYSLGYSYELAKKYIEYAGIVMALILVIFIASYLFAAKYAKKQIKKIEQEEKHA